MERNDYVRIKPRKEGVRTTELVEQDGIAYLRYRVLSEYSWLTDVFSTRIGGVSTGQYSSMNLSFTVGDAAETVRENFRLIGKAIGVKPEQMVYAKQTHTANVMRVGKMHCGMGVIKERDFTDIDGIMTDETGVCLVTSYADCTPLYFVDPVHRAIALSHSGWRGTYGDICGETIRRMKEYYGTEPAELVCCIGPCIGAECYEVGEELGEKFAKRYPDAAKDGVVEYETEGKKSICLDLAEINRYLMRYHGVREEHIHMPDLCTACNATWLHSHRASGGKRGGMCAFLMLKGN